MVSQFVTPSVFVGPMKITKGNKEIAKAIIQLRGERVILDFHLALLYEVRTSVLKQQVRRNIDRFPQDFMFELSDDEIEFLILQEIVKSKSAFGGARPMAFTEQGVAMLSSVLRSQKAVAVNIAIMRTFVHVRRMLQENRELARKIKSLEKKYDQQFHVVFEAIRKLIEPKSTKRKPIGYRTKNWDLFCCW